MCRYNGELPERETMDLDKEQFELVRNVLVPLQSMVQVKVEDYAGTARSERSKS